MQSELVQTKSGSGRRRFESRQEEHERLRAELVKSERDVVLRPFALVVQAFIILQIDEQLQEVVPPHVVLLPVLHRLPERVDEEVVHLLVEHLHVERLEQSREGHDQSAPDAPPSGGLEDLLAVLAEIVALHEAVALDAERARADDVRRVAREDFLDLYAAAFSLGFGNKIDHLLAAVHERLEHHLHLPAGEGRGQFDAQFAPFLAG